jgi:hypothetical protein
MPQGALESILAEYERRLGGLVAVLPLHLMREQEMRRTLAEVLLHTNRVFYSQVRNLQYEKSWSGMPQLKPVDLYFLLDSVSCFVEFKYWHTMLKVRSSQLEIGKGNATREDYRKMKDDFIKQAGVETRGTLRLIICLAQVQQYPRSTSQLMVEHAEQSDPENARALFHSSPGVVLSVHYDGRAISFEMERDALELASPEGIAFRMFTYRVVE